MVKIMNYYEYGDDKIDVLDRVLSLISTREYGDALECIDNLNSNEFSDPLLLMNNWYYHPIFVDFIIIISIKVLLMQMWEIIMCG